MTEAEKIKRLREEAWGLQNKLSGRPGLGNGAPSLPSDLNSKVHKLCSSAIAACGDFEQGYIDPDDFNERADRFYKKLSDIKTIIHQTEKEASAKPLVSQEIPKQKKPQTDETPVEFGTSENHTSSSRFNEVAQRIETSVDAVDLRGLELSDVDISSVIELCDVSKIRKIDLRNNAICDYGCQLLAGLLASGKCLALGELDLSGNTFGVAGKAALVHGLQIIRKDLIINL